MKVYPSLWKFQFHSWYPHLCIIFPLILISFRAASVWSDYYRLLLNCLAMRGCLWFPYCKLNSIWMPEYKFSFNFTFNQGNDIQRLLKASAGTRNQQLKIGNSESQPLDSWNIVMVMSNYLARLDFPSLSVSEWVLNVTIEVNSKITIWYRFTLYDHYDQNYLWFFYEYFTISDHCMKKKWVPKKLGEVPLAKKIMQMKLAHGPLEQGYTKSHIWGHALSRSGDY